MANIKFNYLYRDGGNYKRYNFIIFKNPDNITIENLSAVISSKLIDNTWFYANQWNLPDLRQKTFDSNIDPTWHEFESINYTKVQPNSEQTLDQFLTHVTIP